MATASPRAGSNRNLLIVLAVVIIGGIVVYASCGRATDDGATPVQQAQEAPERVRLEPISSAIDPFAPPGQAGQDETITPVKTNAVTTVEGSRVGLYGGTMNHQQCDKDQLATFLEQNPDKGAAWAGVLGIRQADIRSYIAGLTPMLLRSDTRVTNHGFVNGRATPVPAVLQAGTAVLVDDKGVPVTKCYCGNALRPPIPPTTNRTTTTTPTNRNTTTTNRNTTTTYYDYGTTTTYDYAYPAEYYGDSWEGFSKTSWTVVKGVDVGIDVFYLVDKSGKAFIRPRGTDGSQDTPADGQIPATPTPDAPRPPARGPSPTPSDATPTATTTTTRSVERTTTTVPPDMVTPTTRPFVEPSEPCVDENNNIVPCP